MTILRLFSHGKAFYNPCQRLLHNSTAWNKLLQFRLSDIGEGIAEVQVKEWHVKVGDQVNEFDEICAVQSDKASVTITSRYTGTIKRLYFQPDDIAKVGQPLIDIEVPDELGEEAENEIGQEEIPNVGTAKLASKIPLEPGKVLASPAVRRLIREHGLKAADISGSGPNGRVVKEDVVRIVQQNGQESGGAAIETTATDFSSSNAEASKGDRIVPIRGYTRAMIRTMTEALAIPHFGYGDEIVAEELVKAREQLAKIASAKGIKMSYMPIIIKATSLALKEFPVLNSSLDERKENLVYKHSHNICFAMDTADGLAVPNIKDCQGKSVWEIALEMGKLMERGKAKRFSKEDLAGGTFTLSNIGSIGGTFMSPVILPPQVAIGAIGKMRKVPVLEEEGDDEEYEPTVGSQSVMNVFWAADHRVIDGATLARFSNRFKQLLENPALMMAELH